MNKQKKLYQADKQLEELMIKDHPEWEAQLKLQKAKYFYLFKEARIRQVRGDHLS
ncbi:MAG: YaaL family protein [Alkalibacterium thalassium]|nr:YaaL family protein [Alkalibacterium thalassium]